MFMWAHAWCRFCAVVWSLKISIKLDILYTDDIQFSFHRIFLVFNSVRIIGWWLCMCSRKKRGYPYLCQWCKALGMERAAWCQAHKQPPSEPLHLCLWWVWRIPFSFWRNETSLLSQCLDILLHVYASSHNLHYYKIAILLSFLHACVTTP